MHGSYGGRPLALCLHVIPSIRAQRWAVRSIHAADIAARQTRIIAADTLRQARRRYSRQTSS